MSRDAEVQNEIVVKRSSWSKKRNRDGLRSDLTPAKKRLSAEQLKTTEDGNVMQVNVDGTATEQVTRYCTFIFNNLAGYFINTTSFRIQAKNQSWTCKC